MSGSPVPIHRYLALDSLRGVCACMIVLLHLTTFGVINRSTFVQNGFLFVDFFFVLSGFVIAASYGDKLAQGFSILKFMGLRLGRIYPLHVFMLGLFLAFEIVYSTGLLGSGDRPPFGTLNSIPMLFANLFLLQTFVGPETSWNFPSWSIAVEVWTYLIYAFVFRFAGKLLVLVALALAAACCAYLPFVSDRYLAVFHEGTLARCVYGFSLGVVCFRLHRSGIIPRLSFVAGSGLEVLVVMAVITIVLLAAAGPLSLAVPPVFFLAVLVFSGERGLVSDLLKRAPFLALGKWSYSIYMIHLFLELRIVNLLALISRASGGRLALVATDQMGNHVGGSAAFGDLMSILTLGLTIAAASLTYRWVEEPAKLWSRSLMYRRKLAVA